MTDSTCLQYLEDPEANAAHLDACAGCRALATGLQSEVAAAPLQVDVLPLAPWEGASHRPWPLVAGGSLAILVLAIALFVVTGGAPLASEMTRLELLRSFLRLAPGALQSAPLSWQVAIGIAFIVVNTLLYLLLRRSPRGVDA